MIQYKETSIKIFPTGFSTITGEIQFNIECNLSDGDKLGDLFKFPFSLDGAKLVHNGSLLLGEMDNLITNVFKIDQTDVGKYVKPAAIGWLDNIIYSLNPLKLVQSDWHIE